MQKEGVHAFRRMGKTEAGFFRDGQAALEAFQPGLFDDIIEG